MASDNEPESAAGAAVPYRVLARKYRPQSFDDLIGQAPMVRTLTNAFDAGRIAQAWMLTGVRGVGKTTTARILARALNYETASVHRPTIHMDAPGIHDQAIMEGRHVDVVEMDAASHTGIDDIREIIAQVRYRPVSARYKVYIIDEVHMLSTQAFNGLLKTLEEPPEHVKFVFATTEIRKVPITVLSRCQRFDLRRVEAGELIAHLKRVLAAESVEADENALRLIARAAEGSVRDALSLADQAIAHGAGRIEEDTARDMLGLADRVRVIDLFEHLMRGDARAAITELREQHASGADPAIVLAELADFTHLVTSLRYVPEAAGDAALSPAEAERGQHFARTLSVRTLGQVWQMLLKAVEEARLAASPRQAAEMALIRIAHAADMPSPDELVRRIAAGGGEALGLPAPRPNGGAGAASARSEPSAERAEVPSAERAVAPPAPPLRPEPPRAVASSGAGLAARMLAPSPEQVPLRAPSAVLPNEGGEGPGSLEELDQLAADKRDSRMRVWIRRYVRLVRIEPGRLEIEIAGSAPVSLAGDLAKRLNDWTGRRWVVSLATSGGGRTLEEAALAEREALFAEAARDPEVAAILAMMPGATIRDVRRRGEAAREDEDDAADLAASVSDDGLPERIDIDPADFMPDLDETGEATPDDEDDL